MKKALLLLFAAMTIQGIAQTETGWFQETNMKGKLNFHWGYNRAAFTKSDYHFKGENFDFVLKKVQALDKPATVGVDPYLTGTGFTVPQYNYRVGYFIGKRWNIGIGMDHMKYVMVQDQVVKADGYIEYETSEGVEIRHEFENYDVQLTEDFLIFEHTDGLNYLNVEAEYYQNLYRFDEKHQINVYAGGGGGMLIPKSNVQLMGYERNDEFHIAGYGISAKLGLNVNLFKFLYLQTELKGGYINMPDVLIRPGDNSDRASHDFFFSQWNFVVGGYIQLGKN